MSANPAGLGTSSFAAAAPAPAPAPAAGNGEKGYSSFFSKGSSYLESEAAAAVGTNGTDVKMAENKNNATSAVPGGAKKRPADGDPGDADSEHMVRMVFAATNKPPNKQSRTA